MPEADEEDKEEKEEDESEPESRTVNPRHSQTFTNDPDRDRDVKDERHGMV